MSKKKIIFVITKSNFGGAQRYVFDIAQGLHKEGFDISIAAGGKGSLYEKAQRENLNTIEIPDMIRDISFFKELKAFIFLYKLFKKESPDVVHLNSSKAGLGALAARLGGVRRIIFTLHGLATNEDRPWYQKIILRLIYRVTILLCHETIAVSDALKEQAERELGFVSKKIVVIKNGILQPDFKNRAESLDILQKATGGKTDLEIASLIIGTVGELHPIKGHAYLLQGFRDALYRSPVPLYLFIVGDGQKREIIKQEIEDMSLKDNVFMCGHVHNADQILRAFDIFILPSLSEGLPYVLIEAGSAGLPTIATKVGGIPEIIEDQITGLLISPRSATEVSESILKLVYNPNLRKQTGENLQKRINAEFNFQRELSQTKEIYNL